MRFVLQGAEVVDGTGSPRRRADVAVVGGHIAEVAESIEPRGDPRIDLGGLILAPGFIDPHTHFDAQVLWDRDLTPSSWHGVTTVVTGNCGFGIAPTKPEHRATIMRTLENVEGMPLDALEAGLPWTFETFPQYLDAVDGAPNRLNIACLAGHTPLRFYVLGDEATERAGHRRRAGHHAAVAAGSARCRRGRVLHVAFGIASWCLRPAGSQPGGHPGGDPAAGLGPGRVRPRHVRGHLGSRPVRRRVCRHRTADRPTGHLGGPDDAQG